MIYPSRIFVYRRINISVFKAQRKQQPDNKTRNHFHSVFRETSIISSHRRRSGFYDDRRIFCFSIVIICVVEQNKHKTVGVFLFFL